MPSISQLNVRLGLIYKDLDKGLEQVERKLRASGRRLSQLGDGLTVAISAPLAAIGVSAIQQAGEIESLKLAMTSTFETAGRSAAEAANEVEALRKAALAPGLDFEQAIKGSIRLQGVGYDAESARTAIEQVANAIALTGGTAQNLDSVTVQFAQMIAKGKVLSQDLRIIQENMPIVSRLMQQAFGTQNADRLQALGISGKEFVSQITAAAAQLPRVEGGIKNSIVNAGAAARQSLAKLGEEINRAFDIPKTLDGLTVGLQGLVQGFADLDDGTKRTIVSLGLAAVAAGPLIKVFGVLKLSAAQTIDVLQGLVGGLKSATTVAFGLAEAGNRVKLAFGIVGIVAAVAAAVYVLAENFNAAEYATDQFARAQRDVIAETSKERGELEKNFDVLKNVTSTHSDRKAAIDTLLKQYPEYLKGINLEIQSVDQLTAIQKGLTAEIERGVAARKKAQAINSIYEKRADILLRIQQLRDGAQVTASEATLINTSELFSAGSLAEGVILKLQAQADGLKTSINTVGKQFDDAFGLVGQSARRATPASQVLKDIGDNADGVKGAAEGTDKFAASLESTGKKAAKAKSEIDKYLDNLREVKNRQDKIREVAASLGLSPLDTLPQAGGGPVTSQQPKFIVDPARGGSGSPIDAARVGTSLVESLTPAQALFEGLSTSTITFNEAFTTLAENVAVNGTLMQKTLLSVSDAVTSFADGGGASLGGFVNALVDGAKKAVGAYIRMGVAAIVAKSLTKAALNPFAALALGAIAGAAAQTLFNNVLGKIKIPAFANGTEFAPGGLSLVGERGPELVKLPRGTAVKPNPMLNRLIGGQNIQVGGQFVVKGTDLVVVLEKQTALNQRVRGY
jgi:tape measure domain-containing protein